MTTLIFVDINKEVLSALQEVFNDNRSVCYFVNDYFHYFMRTGRVNAEYILTPGNSYGDMSGGFDLAIRDWFGKALEWDIRSKIVQQYSPYSLLPIGEAIATSIKLDNGITTNIIYAPTMERPSVISDKNDIYKSFKAALLQVKNKNATIVTPGFGTLTGNLDYKVAAMEMYKAYIEVFGLPL